MLCVYCYVSNKLNKNTVQKKKEQRLLELEGQIKMEEMCLI